MKSFRFVSLFLCAALFLFAGCATVKELAPEKRKGEPSTAEYKISRDLLICFMNNDPKGFCAKLSPENSKEFDVKKFAETRKDLERSLGTPVSFSYLTELEFVAFKLHVWKIRFKRLGKDPKTREEKEFYSESLFRVITGRTGRNELLVMGFNFL